MSEYEALVKERAAQIESDFAADVDLAYKEYLIGYKQVAFAHDIADAFVELNPPGHWFVQVRSLPVSDFTERETHLCVFCQSRNPLLEPHEIL